MGNESAAIVLEESFRFCGDALVRILDLRCVHTKPKNSEFFRQNEIKLEAPATLRVSLFFLLQSKENLLTLVSLPEPLEAIFYQEQF